MSIIPTTSRPTKQSTLIVLIILLLLLLTAQSPASVQWWISSRDMSKRLTPGPRLTFESEHVPTKPVIRINGNKTYQTMIGLGSSREHSTCYNISFSPPDVQEDAMERIRIDAGKDHSRKISGVTNGLLPVQLRCKQSNMPLFFFNDFIDGFFAGRIAGKLFQSAIENNSLL